MQQMNMMEGRNFKWSVLSSHWQTGEPPWSLPVCLQGADRFIWSSFHARKYEQQWDRKTCRCTNECISIRLKQRLCQGAHSLQIIYVRAGQDSINNAEHRVESRPASLPSLKCMYVSHFNKDKLWRGAFFSPNVRILKDKARKMDQHRKQDKLCFQTRIRNVLPRAWHNLIE